MIFFSYWPFREFDDELNNKVHINIWIYYKVPAMMRREKFDSKGYTMKEYIMEFSFQPGWIE